MKYHITKKQLESEQRSQIVILLDQGMSTREVAKKIGTSQTTVVNTKKKYEKYKLFKHLRGNGRRKKCSKDVMSIIINENKKTA
jgi:transposase